jgi:LPS sulfotransferase NodH
MTIQRTASMTPFIIVGMPRTGSTLLMTTLSQHPRALVYGELFHTVESERRNAHAIRRGDKTIFFDPQAEDAIAFLKRNVWSVENTKHLAVGFKVFGEYVKAPTTERLFVRLKEKYPSLKVIHITRTKYLDAFVSRGLAQRSKEWVRYADSKTNESEVNGKRRICFAADPISLQKFIDSMQEADSFFANHFGGENYIAVDYDGFVLNYQSESQRIYTFLGLDVIEAKQKTLKQNPLKPKDVLTNFADLRRIFRGTKYETYFAPTRVNPNYRARNELEIGDFFFELATGGPVREKVTTPNHFTVPKTRNLVDRYTEIFDQLMPSTLLELDLRRGGSTALYNLYLTPNVHVGIDQNHESITALEPLVARATLEGRKLRLHYGVDQRDRNRLVEILQADFGEPFTRPLDFVINHASHLDTQSIVAFETIFSYMRGGGLYIVENLDWAHHKDYHVGSPHDAKEDTLAHFIYRLMVCAGARPDVISEIRVTGPLIVITRGPAELRPDTFRLDDLNTN